MDRKRDGTIMSKDEEKWMQDHEEERFGQVLERDVNGSPKDEDKLRDRDD